MISQPLFSNFLKKFFGLLFRWFSSGRGAACKGLEGAARGFCRGVGFTPCKGVQAVCGASQGFTGANSAA